MKTIGLTGGIACGKSAVARLLRVRGVPVVDADQVSRQVVSPGSEGMAAVVARFGAAIVQPDGSLDRTGLRGIVSADPNARKDLEAITHPRIFAGIKQWLEDQARQQHPVAVVEAALMVETGSWRLYDALLVVACQPATQLARLMARDGMPEADARRWLATQMPVAEKATYGTAVIWNDEPFQDGGQGALEAALDAAWARLNT